MTQTKHGKICIAVVIAMALFFIGWILIRPVVIKKNCYNEAAESAKYDMYGQFSNTQYERCLMRNGF